MAPRFLEKTSEFIGSRLLGRYRSLWRMMKLMRPYRSQVILANILLFLSHSVSTFALVSMVPFLNELFARWEGQNRAPSAQVRMAEPDAQASPESAAKPDSSEESAGERRRRTWRRMVEKSAFLQKAETAVKNTYRRVIAWAGVTPERYIGVFSVYIVCMLVFAGILLFVGDLIMAKVGIQVTSSLLRQVFGNVLEQEMLFFDRTPTGQLINTCYREVFQVRPMVKLLASTRPLLPVKMGITFIAALCISIHLSLLFLVLMPVIVLPAMLLTRRLKKSTKGELRGETQTMNIITEAFHGIRAIKAFAAEQLEKRYLEPSILEYIQVTRRRRMVESLIGPVVDLLNSVVLLAVFATAFLLFDKDSGITAATLGIFLVAVTRFYKPFRSLMTMNVKMQRTNMIARRIFELLDRRAEIVDAPEAVDFPKPWGELALEDVHFTVTMRRKGKDEVRRILCGVDMRVARGEMVAIVGPNGAGKSSIMNLICRLYDPTSGTIRFDDTPVSNIRIASLRENICLITQYPVLFNRSVRENIAFGLETVPDEEIVRAAKMTGCHDFIMQRPGGYESEVGEQGRLLSGGERQRIVLARAFVRHPELLILDEPTTGLDVDARREFIELVHHVRDNGSTVIYITHDWGELDRFDRILRVNEERRLEEVTLEELTSADAT